MENNDQIAALAREYAEETGKEFPTALYIKQSNMENHLRWLCDRYCLVEKSKIREAYKDAQKDQHNSEGDFALTLAGRNRSAVLIDLFPEIAKEVES